MSRHGPRRWHYSKARRRCLPQGTFCSCTVLTVVMVAIRRRATRSSILLFVHAALIGAFATWRLCRTLPKAPDSRWPRLSRCRPTTSVWFSNEGEGCARSNERAPASGFLAERRIDFVIEPERGAAMHAQRRWYRAVAGIVLAMFGGHAWACTSVEGIPVFAPDVKAETDR